MVELYKESGFKGRLLFSDIAYSSELVKTLGDKSNGIEGIAGVSDPTTGFDMSYQVKFGEKPSLGKSAVYDAVMVACYASQYATVQGVEMNEAIASLLNLEPEGKGMWTAGSMSRIFESIEHGETPAFSGASGNLDFSTDHYTFVLLDRIDKNPEIPLRDLYTSLFQQTLESHVSVYNADFYGSVYRNNMREYIAFP